MQCPKILPAALNVSFFSKTGCLSNKEPHFTKISNFTKIGIKQRTYLFDILVTGSRLPTLSQYRKKKTEKPATSISKCCLWRFHISFSKWSHKSVTQVTQGSFRNTAKVLNPLTVQKIHRFQKYPTHKNLSVMTCIFEILPVSLF